ncbi:MAG TPA: NADH-quinone oxidoreductase subunit N, partial [Deinococcales bacterium]|nr:NADH-quinone oxidoreductase subunit N [Deinococcales bacterium]
MLNPPEISLAALLPTLIALLTAALVTVIGFFVPRRTVAWISLIGLAAAVVADVTLWNRNLVTFGGSFRADNFAIGFGIVLLVAGILAVLSSLDSLDRSETGFPEFYAILCYAITGTMLLAHAGDLIVLLIGFEIMSLGAYVLAAFQSRVTSEEAGMKYFLLGSLASAVMIYGIALTFGATGSFQLSHIATAAAAPGFNNGLLLGAGALFMLVGFGFKVAWAPFHQWTPDVYTGAPTIVTQYMSVGIKAAAFAGLIRLYGTAFGGITAWVVPTQILLALTMLVGNLAALRQSSLKRMLAYSSIAQAGYIGLAVLASQQSGWSSALFYLAGYTLMNAGAFAVVIALSTSEDGPDMESLAGLGRRRPGLAAALTLFMLSLAGLPPLVGFVGKYLVLAAAAEGGYYGLVVLAAITSAISLVYYLRPVMQAYFREPGHVQPALPAVGFGVRAVVIIGVAGTIALGVLP